MWIRSQDKETLKNCETIYLDSNCISGRGNTDKYSILGYYSTKEKALKVLDMIHNKIIELDKNKFLGMTEQIYIRCVFQMPQDDEVEE